MANHSSVNFKKALRTVHAHTDTHTHLHLYVHKETSESGAPWQKREADGGWSLKPTEDPEEQSRASALRNIVRLAGSRPLFPSLPLCPRQHKPTKTTKPLSRPCNALQFSGSSFEQKKEETDNNKDARFHSATVESR